MASRIVFEHGGRRYHTGDLKVSVIETLEVELGVPYADIKVFGHMKHKSAMMRALLATDHTAAEAAAIVADLTLDQVEASWSFADDDLPDVYEDGVPLTGGVPSTVTS